MGARQGHIRAPNSIVRSSLNLEVTGPRGTTGNGGQQPGCNELHADALVTSSPIAQAVTDRERVDGRGCPGSGLQLVPGLAGKCLIEQLTTSFDVEVAQAAPCELLQIVKQMVGQSPGMLAQLVVAVPTIRGLVGFHDTHSTVGEEITQRFGYHRRGNAAILRSEVFEDLAGSDSAVLGQ